MTMSDGVFVNALRAPKRISGPAATDAISFLAGMAWIAPLYERTQVNVAGRTRIDKSASDAARESALGIVNNWRSAHSFPLQCLKMTLRNRARQIFPRALIAQRLKRLVAIEAKLRRFPDMKLSQMQDIGGCRAILATVSHVYQLVALYKQGKAKNPRGRHGLVHEDDYIVTPKEDGYRSVHLVYRYYSTASKHKVFNDLKIEIQLRSRLQHAWATAVETVDTFSGQALKSDRGEKDWARFFALMGSAIAIREHRPIVPNTPADPKEMVRELRALAHKLKVERTLEAWRYSIKWLSAPARRSGAYLFLLYLDPEGKTLDIMDFKSGDLLKAQEAYARAEKRVQEQPGAQAVLVSVEELSLLRRAYPNYFLDTRAFLREVRRATA